MRRPVRELTEVERLRRQIADAEKRLEKAYLRSMLAHLKMTVRLLKVREQVQRDQRKVIPHLKAILALKLDEVARLEQRRTQVRRQGSKGGTR